MANPLNSYKNFQSSLRNGVEWVKNECRKIAERSKDLPAANFDLGKLMIRHGHLNDAIFRFRMATWMRPGFYEAWLYLGCCYIAKQKPKEAAEAIKRALFLEPASPEAKFLLANVEPGTVAPGSLPQTMPAILVISLFDILAKTYDEAQTANGYIGHTHIYKGVSEFLDPERKNHIILDLGCGTGLCGPPFAPIKEKLVGVDLSGAMLERAENLTDPDEKKIYDAVHHQDLRQYLALVVQPEYDIIMAANVLGHIGDLDAVFAQVKAALKPGGIFAFSTEFAPAQGYELLSGMPRFGYSSHYLHGLTERHGFTLLKQEEFQMRTDVRAQQFILRKPA